MKRSTMRIRPESATPLLLFGLAALGACASGGGQPTVAPAGAATVEVGRVVDTRGVEHDLEAALASGKSVAFVFFQPWCGSCKAEAPDVVRASRRFADSLQVVGVVSGPEGSVDEESVTSAIIGWGLTYPVVRDRDLALTERFDVKGVPTIVVVGPDGTVTYTANETPAQWRAEG